MASPKKLVLFVEGPGDKAAVPVLVKRLITEMDGWDALRLDKDLPWMLGGVESVTKDNGDYWQKKLRAVQKKKDLGAVLLLLDGDPKSIRKVGDEFHYFGAHHWLPGDNVRDIAVGKQVVYVATDAGLGIIRYEPYTLLKKAAWFERELDEWGFKRLGFARPCDRYAPLAAIAEVRLDHPAQVRHIDHDLAKPIRRKLFHMPGDQGFAAYFDQRLGQRLGQRLEALAASRGKDHRAHQNV